MQLFSSYYIFCSENSINFSKNINNHSPHQRNHNINLCKTINNQKRCKSSPNLQKIININNNLSARNPNIYIEDLYYLEKNNHKINHSNQQQIELFLKDIKMEESITNLSECNCNFDEYEQFYLENKNFDLNDVASVKSKRCTDSDNEITREAIHQLQKQIDEKKHEINHENNHESNKIQKICCIAIFSGILFIGYKLIKQTKNNYKN